MLSVSGGRTLPGWRDFERAIALALGGFGTESKAIFDVLLTDEDQPNLRYGLSCKMRKELRRISRDGRVTIELSNSSGQFWDQLALKNVTPTNYKTKPSEVGETVVGLVQQWHQNAGSERQGSLNISRSSYLVLSWSDQGRYQLHQFSLTLPDPMKIKWYFPPGKVEGSAAARHLNGDDADGRVFEWYGESGGQLKYYPKADSALWQSDIFRLEPLPEREHGILAKSVYKKCHGSNLLSIRPIIATCMKASVERGDCS